MPSADLNARLVLQDRLSNRLRRPAGAIRNFVRGSLRNLFSLRTAFISLGVVAAARAADSVTVLENKLRAVTGSAEEAESAFNGLLRISRETRSSFEDNATAFQRLTLATDSLGLKQREVLDLVQQLNLAVKLSGATSAEASAGLIQFGQGLGAGALRGDELRSVLEQLPEVARIIAREFGVGTAELKKLGERGLLTADRIVEAFRKADKDLKQNFQKTVPTIGEAFLGLTGDLKLLIAEFGEGTGATDLFTGSLQGLRTVVQGLTDDLKKLDEIDPRELFLPLQGGAARIKQIEEILETMRRHEDFGPPLPPEFSVLTGEGKDRQPSLPSRLERRGFLQGRIEELPPIPGGGGDISHLTDTNEALGRQGALLTGIKQGAGEVRQAFSTLSLARDAVQELSFVLVDGISDNLSAIIEGTKSVKDAFADMAKGILNDLQRMIVRALIARAVGALIGGIAGGSTTGATAGATASGATGLFIRPGQMRKVTVHGGRHGEVILPLGQRFNAGGLVGGGGGTTNIININATDAQSFERLFLGAAARRSGDLSTIVVGRARSSARLGNLAG